MAETEEKGVGEVSANIDAAAFKSELEALCEKYGVALITTHNSSIEVWRKHPIDDWVDWAEDWDQTE